MKSWLEKNAIEMYSIHNERKSVVSERLIRTLKNKIYKYMNINVYIDKLDDIVNKYNNIYHRTIIEQGRVCVSKLNGRPCSLQRRTAGSQGSLDKSRLCQMSGRSVR